MNPDKPEISGDEWLLFLLLMAMCPRPPVKTPEELERDENKGHGDVDE